MADRRWAGAFRVCAACGGRNWVGARRCRACAALLVGVRAVTAPKMAMVGRRAADRVLTPRVRAAAMAGAVFALLGGGTLLYLLRADGFEEMRAPAATEVPPPASPAATPEAAASARPADLPAALRSADLGRDLLRRGEVKSALSLLGEATHTLPDDAELAHLYGEALWEFGSRDRALFQYQRAVKLSPETAAYREDLARALQALGRPAQAARLLYGPPGLPPTGAATDPVPPVSLEGGVDLGGAGSGKLAGRRSFTDADLGRRVPAPAPAPEGPR